jgi:cofilin
MELAALKTAKEALDLGLITPQDYDVVKVAFLKAQQLRAGRDAGLMREEDYVKLRDSFLSALDFTVMTTLPAATDLPAEASAGPYKTTSLPAHAAAHAAMVAGSASAPTSGPPTREGSGALPAGDAVMRTPVPSTAVPAVMAAAMGAAAGGSRLRSTTVLNGSGDLATGSTVQLPPDMPDTCRGATEGKVGSRFHHTPPAPPLPHRRMQAQPWRRSLLATGRRLCARLPGAPPTLPHAHRPAACRSPCPA